MTEDQSQGNPHNMPDRIPGAPMPPHPKESLYAHAYDPVVAEWFLNLQSSEALGEFLESAPSRELSQNLQGLIPVFDRRSDEVMATMEAAHRGVMDTIHLHRDNVIWGKDEVLPESPVVKMLANYLGKSFSAMWVKPILRLCYV
jgi:hypothetical protein